MKLIKDLGMRPIGKQGQLKRFGIYICECGNEKIITTANVNSGNTISCGCKTDNRSHGLASHPLYKTWAAMKERCNNPENKNYGGRGISVCYRWVNSLSAFIEDMGERPSKDYSIDRIDNDKGYSKDNCRWATNTEQNNNRSNNRLLTAYNISRTMAQWTKILEIPKNRISGRLSLGWSHHDALFLPKNTKVIEQQNT